MRNKSLWDALLGLADAVIESVDVDETSGQIVVQVRIKAAASRRCGRCLRRCPRYDQGTSRRRWRHMDAGVLMVWIVAEAPRVSCRDCGVVTCHIPWARAGAGHTADFDHHIAWLATNASKTTVATLARIAWRTVGAIITRVWADIEACTDRFANLSRIGIDEISYKKGQRYLTMVVDHDTGRLLWAGVGRDTETVDEFFDALGPERCVAITHVSADAAPWIAKSVRTHCPGAIRCADAFHVVAWATKALDTVRRQAWNTAAGRARDTNRTGRNSTGAARVLKGARWALWKNPEDLTTSQHHKLTWIAKTDPALWRAYLLKEGLRHVFKIKGAAGKTALDRWLSWAVRCRIPAFVELASTIKRNRTEIDNALDHNLSNALIESINTKIRRITRTAYGFTNPEALIALALLAHSGHRPQLPGRTTHG
ncbi:transposase IS204/IS1001/IS1096/IS1165 family protein [Catenulispora acidiphila DSM 44928]|uniref:Transposase IS204/IS1001/IS1096/IS1165 family protein n=1 Tax=Catenulispora acidiphila (strain DSM 44928 / JCM 14897 / NBRC 102108 / NRRL B-24433 / ID139908) TaxID=479433 RepID=C7PYP1_CATAD|nr:ISL3 family transposase [Catenulispora acidiphila]ACU77363.1 transposase IS204/IS1001/IS1096/IS1165 family protein [Catenulispora acidiphila DSM 44928]